MCAACVRAQELADDQVCVSVQEIDELYKIFQTLGTPCEATWPGVSHFPDYKASTPCGLAKARCPAGLAFNRPGCWCLQDEFPRWKPCNIADAVPHLSPEGQDLLQRMLTYVPSQRITARAALQVRARTARHHTIV